MNVQQVKSYITTNVWMPALPTHTRSNFQAMISHSVHLNAHSSPMLITQTQIENVSYATVIVQHVMVHPTSIA